MAEQHPTITFEDIPLEQARMMGRGPRMNPALYCALPEKIQSLSDTATRMTLAAGTSATTMKNRILRVAAAPHSHHHPPRAGRPHRLAVHGRRSGASPTGRRTAQIRPAAAASDPSRPPATRIAQHATDFLDGKDINLAMIEAGLAEVYRGPASGNPYKLQYRAAEATAKQAKKSMWIGVGVQSVQIVPISWLCQINELSAY